MHSHDRTLLAKLGFGDPDKKEPVHDLICQYLATWEAGEKVSRIVIGGHCRRDVRRSTRVDGEQYEFRGQRSVEIQHFSPEFEVPIGKGRGEYKTTVGFMDLVISGQYEFVDEGEKMLAISPDGMRTPHRETSSHRFNVVVEAKVIPIGASEIIRQINLYREYFTGDLNGESIYWATALAFDPTPGDVEMLRKSHITPFRLSDAFDDWVDAQRSATRAGEGARCLTI